MEVVAVGMLTRASHTRELELKREARRCTSPAAVSQREGEVNTPAFVFYSLDAGGTRVSKADTVPTLLTKEEARRACSRHCSLCSLYWLIHYPSSPPLEGHAFASPPLGGITEAQRNCYLFRVTPQLGERAGPSTSILLFIPTLLNY